MLSNHMVTIGNSKTIRVSKDVYNFVDGKGERGESFDKILKRLLKIK